MSILLKKYILHINKSIYQFTKHNLIDQYKIIISLKLIFISSKEEGGSGLGGMLLSDRAFCDQG